MDTVFWGKIHLSLGVEADRRSDLFSIQTLGELKFFASDRHCFFGQKCDEESVGQAGGQKLIHVCLP